MTPAICAGDGIRTHGTRLFTAANARIKPSRFSRASPRISRCQGFLRGACTVRRGLPAVQSPGPAANLIWPFREPEKGVEAGTARAVRQKGSNDGDDTGTGHRGATQGDGDGPRRL